MDFNDTPEEAAYRANAYAFLSNHLKLRANDRDNLQKRLSEVDYMKAAKHYQRAKADHGFAGITWPKDQGGQGLSQFIQ
ncbi:MAG: hypothetical protein HC777_00755 [Hyphomonadaceae bacterium]|nr:hypothetical protein [Hyphomonadaceae bacterium]